MRKIIIVGVLASLLVPVFASAQGAPCPSAMSFGSRGPNVIRVQQVLNKAYQEFAADLITGYFGKLTEAAVKQWQKDNGIVSSGTPATTGYGAVGPRTARAMGLCGGGAPAPTSVPPTPAPQAACILGNVLIAHGSSVTRFQSPVVQPGSSCIAQSRVCTNGVLSGTFTHLACTVEAPPTPPAASAACTPPTRDLRLGDEDASTAGQVSVLQRFLARDSAIYPEGLITGFYGPASERAVVRFQKANNISPTGYVGAVTRAAMKAKCEGKPPPQPTAASFRAAPAAGGAPLIVTFTAVGFESYTGHLYVVDFGDGERGQMQVGANALTASHTYTKSGTFDAKLLEVEYLCGGISMGYGCDRELTVGGETIYISQIIDDGGLTPPTNPQTPGGTSPVTFETSESNMLGSTVFGRLRAKPTSGAAPLTVRFWANSFADFAYDGFRFGDGSANLATGSFPFNQSCPTLGGLGCHYTWTHTYSSAGTYKTDFLLNGEPIQATQDVSSATITVSVGGGGGGVSGDLGCADTPRHPADAGTQCFTLSGRTLTIRPGGTVGGPLYFNTLKWGDGAEEAWYNTVPATHTYASTGTYTVALPYMFQVNVNSGSIFEPRTVTKTFTISD